MGREKTDSITHLVKIVATEAAEEVFERRIREFQFEDYNSERVKLSAKRAGQRWEKREDEIFERELSAAITQIALNHNRTIGSIEARIKQYYNNLTMGRLERRKEL